jgi:ribosome modulation factor
MPGAKDGDEMPSPMDKVWSEGYKAGKHDQPLSSSPYKKGMTYQAWVQGWENGQKAREAKA